MDDRTDMDYSIAEEKYLNDYAKFNIGDVVYYENFGHKMSIGIVHERTLLKKAIIRNKKQEYIMTIGYRIINPKGIVLITEPHIVSASQYIFREYLNNKKAD